MKGSQAGKLTTNRKTDNNQENNHCFETTKGKTDNPKENGPSTGTPGAPGRQQTSNLTGTCVYMERDHTFTECVTMLLHGASQCVRVASATSAVRCRVAST